MVGGDLSTVLWIIAILLVAAGFLGMVLPVIPGTLLVAGGLFLAAAIDGFTRVGAFPLILIGLLVLLSYAADILGVSVGTRKAGASKWALLGAAFGVLAGIPFGLPGVLFGPFLGASIAELLTGKKTTQAAKSGVAATLGLILGTILKLVIVITMVGVFAVAYLS